jgi:hypothetical protein
MYVAMYETWKLLRALLTEAEKKNEAEARTQEANHTLEDRAGVDGDLDSASDEEMLRLSLSCLASRQQHCPQPHLTASNLLRSELSAATASASEAAAGCRERLDREPAGLPDFVPPLSPPTPTRRHPVSYSLAVRNRRPDWISGECGRLEDRRGDANGGLLPSPPRQSEKGGRGRVFRVDRSWFNHSSQRQEERETTTKEEEEERKREEDTCDGRSFSKTSGVARTLSERRVVVDREKVEIRRHSFSGDGYPAGRQRSTGGRQLPTDGRRLPTGGRQLPTGGCQLPTGGRQLPTGGRQLPTGGRQLPTGGRQLPTGGRHPGRHQKAESEDHDEEESSGWSGCGSSLARLAPPRRRRSGGYPGRQWPTMSPTAVSMTATAGRGDAQSLLGDVCVFVTIAGAYYCMKKIKAALF